MKNWTAANQSDRITYDDSGAGTPVVLLHAFPQTREMWTMQVEELTKRHRVITPDLYGFGGSSLPANGWRVDGMADAIADFLVGIGITEPIVLGGLSMGGYVALAFARRHPAKLRGLILADTKAEGDSAEAKEGRTKSMALVQEVGVAVLTEQMLPKILGLTTHQERPAIVAEVRRVGAEQSVDGVLAALTALRDRPDATPSLAAIRVPTLVIVGDEDLLTPPDVAKKLASAIPNTTLIDLPLSGHLSNLETPDLFNRAVASFLQTLIPTGSSS